MIHPVVLLMTPKKVAFVLAAVLAGLAGATAWYMDSLPKRRQSKKTEGAAEPKEGEASGPDFVTQH